MRVPLLLLTLMMVLGGCVSSGTLDSEPFDPVAAPTWQPGYTWSYHTESTTSYGHGGQVNENTEKGTVALTVFNATAQAGTIPAYFAKVSGSQTMLWDGDTVALARDSLVQVAGRSDNRYGDREYMPHYAVMAPSYDMSSDYYPGYYPNIYDSDCVPSTRLTAVPTAAAFPGLKFPLDDGQAWSGRLDGFDMPAGTYTAKVIGLDTVHVAAGDYDSVHVAIEFSPEAGADMGPGLFTVKADIWYAPAVQNYVKVTLKATYAMLFPKVETNSMSHSLELTSYSLGVKPAEAAPEVKAPIAQPNYQPLQIVSNTAFPVKVMEPTSVTFRLAEAAEGRDESNVETSDGPYYEYDKAVYKIRWMVYGPKTSWRDNGDAFTIELPSAGLYHVSATVESIECGGPSLGGSWASAPTYWEDEWTVNVDPGAGATRTLVAAIPVAGAPARGNLTWTYPGRPSGAAGDDGFPELVDSKGNSVNLGDDLEAIDLGRVSKEASLFWNAEPMTVEDYAAPVILGDDPVIHLRIDYDYGSPGDYVY